MEHRRYALARIALTGFAIAALVATPWGPAPHAQTTRWRVSVGDVAHEAPELLSGVPGPAPGAMAEMAEQTAEELASGPVWTSLRQWLAWTLTPPELQPHDLAYQAWGSGEAAPGASISAWLTRGVGRLLALLAPDEGPSDTPDVSDFGMLVVQPVAGEASSPFGYRRDPITGRRKLHKGMDFHARRGTPVHAAGAGVVAFAGYRGSYGRLIILFHGQGLETRYAHLRSIKVAKGQHVSAGTLIGTVGASGRATGPHLHFEVRRAGEPIDPAWTLATAQSSITDERTAILGRLALPALLE